jgi:hypothetical protein
MATITVTVADVRPLPGALIRNLPVSGTVHPGDVVYQSGGTVGGSVDAANASATATAYGIGICVAVANGGTIATTGDRCDYVAHGPVTGFTGAAGGSPGYAGNSAGILATTAGTVSHKMGYFESPTVFFVNPSNTAT